jgi:probable HAF family extracellular repeat protein
MSLPKLLRWSLAAFAIVTAAAHAAAPSRWTIHDVGAFHPIIGSTAWDINNRGDVVGVSSKMLPGSIAPINRCFLWQNGVMQDLGAPFVWQLGREGDHCTALSINDRGTILAWTGYSETWLYKDGQWTVALPPGAVAINRAEDVAGMYWNGTGYRGFFLSNGVQHEIGTFGGTISNAVALNDKGFVVGSAELPQSGMSHAYVWKDGVMRDLGTLGGEDSHATDINDRGEIVGYTGTTMEDMVAFIADVNGNMRRLMNAPGVSFANGINDRGAVVGVLNGKGFLYDSGVLTVLDDLPQVQAAGWTRLRPQDINDRGWITGVGWNGTQLTAFVLVPR